MRECEKNSVCVFVCVGLWLVENEGNGEEGERMKIYAWF